MNRKLWLTSAVFVIILAVIVALTFLAISEDEFTLQVAVLLLAGGAIIAFDYLVVKPVLLADAKQKARGYCEAGRILDPKLYGKLCKRLGSAPKDAEAAELRKKLEELPQKSN
ncbi:MAG: hypothetical protein PHR43_07185 [Dehalococcoidales bacterium]|nr:hypothetical protein [Dehalococcoidales bacterium]